MRPRKPKAAWPGRSLAVRVVRRFRRNENGATAIEFAFAVTPFLMLVFGIIGITLYYLTETVLDQALTKSVRQIRTGESLTRSGGELTVQALKSQICASSAGLLDCSKLVVHVDTAPNWGTFVPTECVTDDKLTTPAMQDSDYVSKRAGRADNNVVVTVCYPWKLWAKLPYIGAGNIQNGSYRLVQAMIAFKSERYED
jgi:Flp pilus assembly protein TadG